MTFQVLDWVPPDVLLRSDLRTPVEQAVESWSTAWFSRRRLTMNSWRLSGASGAPAEADLAWRTFGGGLAIGVGARGAARMLGAAFDLSLEDRAGSDMDRKVLGQFEQALVADLAARIAVSLGVPGGEQMAGRNVRAEGGVHVGVGESGAGPILHLILARDVLLPLCRRSFSRPRREPDSLQPLSRVLGPTPVRLEGVLGFAELTVAELEGLAPGDVLVLDRGLDSPAELRLASTGALVAEANLTEDAGRRALALTGTKRELR